VCSVALSDNKKIIAEKKINDGYKHAEVLTVFINELFAQNQLNIKQLNAISLNIGPGSYTGLRIGASVAKGIAYALNIPIIGINSLHALYQLAPKNTQNQQAYYIPMLDARRMEVYCSIYLGTDIEIEKPHPHILHNQSFHQYLEKNICYFFGNTNHKAQLVIKHPNAQFIEVEISATAQAIFAHEQYCAKNFLNAAYFEPLYLKAFGEK
jgi:tRNA threonylcarbamoyladenosine biosynthesis protein TsaB